MINELQCYRCSSWPCSCRDGITLLWGDCRTLLPQLPKVDLVLTDPPYGIYACGGKWGRKEELQWDRERAQGVGELIEHGENAIIWGGNYFALPPSRGWLVWWKRDSVQSAADVELAWTSYDRNSRLIDHTIAATNGERCGHPTQKPLRRQKIKKRVVALLPVSRNVTPANTVWGCGDLAR